MNSDIFNNISSTGWVVPFSVVYFSIVSSSSVSLSYISSMSWVVPFSVVYFSIVSSSSVSLSQSVHI